MDYARTSIDMPYDILPDYVTAAIAISQYALAKYISRLNHRVIIITPCQSVNQKFISPKQN